MFPNINTSELSHLNHIPSANQIIKDLIYEDKQEDINSQIEQMVDNTFKHQELKDFSKKVSLEEQSPIMKLHDSNELLYDQQIVIKNVIQLQGQNIINKKEESIDAATQIQFLIQKRKEYFQLRQDWDEIDQVITYDTESQQPFVDWNQTIDIIEQLPKTELSIKYGVYHVLHQNKYITQVKSIKDFIKDLLMVVKCSNDKQVSTFAYTRNSFLEKKFQMHTLLNSEREYHDQFSECLGKDFFNILKVDTHIHHSAGMNARSLLKFIKKKLEQEPDTIVYENDGKQQNLREIANEFNINSRNLSMDRIGMTSRKCRFNRFDNFNRKYNPEKEFILRKIFVKTENILKGRFAAELTKEIIEELDQNIIAEYRITIHGKTIVEWNQKCNWLCDFKMNHFNLRWIMQIPSIYKIYKKQNLVNNYQDILTNIFKPLFDVTINPESNPKLFKSMFMFNCFDFVADETKQDNFIMHKLTIPPNEWNLEEDPHYAYQIYYIYANIQSLNQLRQSRGLNTYDFRPHCGAQGSKEHLACAYLLAKNINHGLILNECPVLKYLFYLEQIGISMSPIANNQLGCKYVNSPFKSYFNQGLNVTLSTDDPLLLHMSLEPLLEEYSIAQQVFNLNNVDLAEIARNSIRCSSLETILREFYVGKYPDQLHKSINYPKRNNLPSSRFLFRQETLILEHQFIQQLCM